MYIQLISKRSKKRAEELVCVINEHNYNTGGSWSIASDRVWYERYDGVTLSSEDMFSLLKWFCDDFLISGMRTNMDYQIIINS